MGIKKLKKRENKVESRLGEWETEGQLLCQIFIQFRWNDLLSNILSLRGIDTQDMAEFPIAWLPKIIDPGPRTVLGFYCRLMK